MSLLKNLGITRRTIAWSLYDFSNSAYALVVMSLVYPLYFTEYVVQGVLGWGPAVALSVGLVGLTSPFVGAFADGHRCRKRLFLAFSIAAVVGTCLLPVTGLLTAALGEEGALGLPGWLPGMLLFMATHVAFGLALFLYDSFLVVVPAEESQQATTTLSGIGWGLGYGGGLLCLLLALIPLGFELPETMGEMHTVFIITGVFFLVFSIPAFLALPDDKDLPVQGEGALPGSFREVFRTLSKPWPHKRLVFLFLAAMYFLQDGLNTVIYFTVIYAEEQLQFSKPETYGLIIFANLVGTLATAPLCWLGEKYGETRALLACAGLWTVIVIGIASLSEPWAFSVMSFLTGLVIGTTPALARGYLSKIIPQDRRAEMFGFNTFAGRISAVFGLGFFTFLIALLGDMRLALLIAVLPFFFGGTALLVLVHREELARRAALQDS